MKAIESADIRPRDLQSPQSSPQSLAPDALFALRHIHGGQLAPDGHGIAFGISETNGREGFSIWVDNGGGDGVRRIPFDGQATLPRWSPQGDAIAFVGDGRLCVSSTEEFSDCRVLGPAHVVVVGPPIWTPDGGAIIAEAETASPPCSGSPISDYDYRAEGVGLLGKPSRRLARFDLKGECFEWLTPSEEHATDAHLESRGRRLIYLAASQPGRAARYRARLVLLELDTGRRTWLTENPWVIGCARLSLDGRKVVFSGTDSVARTGPVLRLFVLDIATGRIEERSDERIDSVGFLAHHDMPVADYVWSNTFVIVDDAWILVTLQCGGCTEIWRLSIEGDLRAEPVCQGERACILVDARSQYDRILFLTSDIRTPLRLVSADLSGSGEKVLVDLNRDVLARWPELELTSLSVESEDGVKNDAWFLAPRHAATPLPTILFIHGGPFSTTGHAFRFDFHLLASRGYGVLFGNFRGSPGYGAEFVRKIMGDWGRNGARDHRATVDAAVAAGIADPARLGIWGASHGGFATCWMVCHDQRFKAAIAEASITDFRTQYYTTDLPDVFADDLGGRPDEIPEIYADRSPLSHVQGCETPILLLHGEDDLRCPISQAEIFYRALKDRKCVVEMLRIPDCNHSGDTYGPLAARQLQNEALVNWFGRFL